MTTFNQAQLRNDLVGLAHNIEAGFTLRDQKEKVVNMLHADHYNLDDKELHYWIEKAANVRTKAEFTRCMRKAMTRISTLVDDFKRMNGSHCKTCRFYETKYDTLFECRTHRVQCVRCDEASAHETTEEYEAKNQARQEREAKSAAAAQAAQDTLTTEKEDTLLLAIAQNGCDGMGGEKPADLHGDNYSWFRAEDMVNLTTFSLYQIAGLMASLDSKGFIQDDGKDWFLTTEGIDKAQGLFENARIDEEVEEVEEATATTLYYNPSKVHHYDIDRTLDHFCNSDLATDYLTKVIDDSSPDYFHWTDIEMANELRANDGDHTPDPVKTDKQYNLPVLKKMVQDLVHKVDSDIGQGLVAGYVAIKRGQRTVKWPEEPVHAGWCGLVAELNETEREIQKLTKRLHGLELVKGITLLHQADVTEDVEPEPEVQETGKEDRLERRQIVLGGVDECAAAPEGAIHFKVLEAPLTGSVDGRDTDQEYRAVVFFLDGKWCVSPQQAFKGKFDQFSGLPAWNLETLAQNTQDFLYIDAGTKWGVSGMKAATAEAIAFAMAVNKGAK
ncbi:MAG: hypothetical protein GY753_11895 [Gammaproteobacteria bacterium]|nr:hypothetical protein [Gammaproteobacteria bacterium]